MDRNQEASLQEYPLAARTFSISYRAVDTFTRVVEIANCHVVFPSYPGWNDRCAHNLRMGMGKRRSCRGPVVAERQDQLNSGIFTHCQMTVTIGLQDFANPVNAHLSKSCLVVMALNDNFMVAISFLCIEQIDPVLTMPNITLEGSKLVWDYPQFPALLVSKFSDRRRGKTFIARTERAHAVLLDYRGRFPLKLLRSAGSLTCDHHPIFRRGILAQFRHISPFFSWLG